VGHHLVDEEDHGYPVFLRIVEGPDGEVEALADCGRAKDDDGVVAVGPQRDCITSLCDGDVGRPVLGPPLMAFTTTQGTSAMMANPRFSCISEKPGPLVAVIDFTPAREAPITAPRLAISSSIWMNVPSTCGSLTESCSAISVAGVMG
jgi:hypothetical protein